MRQERDFRFILTVRDPDEWFDSLVRFNKKLGRTPPIEEDRDKLINERILEHNYRCRELASVYDKLLLELDVTTDPDAAKKITAFLELEYVDDLAMPHLNRTV